LSKPRKSLSQSRMAAAYTRGKTWGNAPTQSERSAPVQLTTRNLS